MSRPILALMACAALVIGCEQSKNMPAKTASAPASSGASSSMKSTSAPAKPTMSSMKKSASASGRYLTAKAIRSLLIGTTLKFKNPRTGEPIQISYKPDGSFSGSETAAFRVFYFDGSWNIKEPDMYCFKSGHRETRRWEGCRKLKHVGGNDYQIVDAETGEVIGEFINTVTIPK